MDFDNYNYTLADQMPAEHIEHSCYPAGVQENRLSHEFAQHLNARFSSLNDSGEKNSMQFGPIAEMKIGNDWNLSKTENSGFRNLQIFKAADNGTATISFHDSLIPVNAGAANLLEKMFTDKINQTHNLSPDEIRSIASVLDRLNAGDNQFTNSASAGDLQAAIFHLDKCQIQQINGKPVLRVEGSFVGQDGTPGRVLQGMIVSGERGSRRIQAIAMEAADKRSLSQHQGSYETMLNSIKWKQ